METFQQLPWKLRSASLEENVLPQEELNLLPWKVCKLPYILSPWDIPLLLYTLLSVGTLTLQQALSD